MRTVTALALAFVVVALSGCGGGSSDEGTAPAPPFQSREYSLDLLTDIGLREAWATLMTGGADDQTRILVDFYVPITEETRDNAYPVGLYEGTCRALGDLRHSFGDLPSRITTVALDEPYTELVSSIDQGELVVAILEPDRKTTAWCGPV